MASINEAFAAALKVEDFPKDRDVPLTIQSVEAMKAFADDVRSGAFPNHEESYHMATSEAEELAGLYGS